MSGGILGVRLGVGGRVVVQCNGLGISYRFSFNIIN